ncbi:exopolyphosphatase PRUNE1-like [Juglans microcarpa x Juglans regia]|uniref:exopolyphosphatase PRUNE1-like n=1 Tax=Juglans microcarpa x Juglans regia TaxID=2249226 RepID=UPI001B7E8313|nr:exopolyphosphatase PRUNE1-like [Juglans microcarpa x Juglans regia]
MRPSRAVAQGHQEPYVRTRENPYFNGLLKGDDLATFDSQGSISSRNISRSPSDIGDFRHGLISNMSGKVMDSPYEDSISDIILGPLDFDFQVSSDSQSFSQPISDIGDTRNKRNVSRISEKVMDSPLENSVSGIILEKFDQPSSERWSRSNNFKTTSFVPPSVQPELNFDLAVQNDSMLDASPTTFEGNDEYHALNYLERPVFEKSYRMEKRKPDLSRIPLPQSAAMFYNGSSPEMEIVESCESVNLLNIYLKARRDDVNAGVPGKFLHAVMGQDLSDVGLIASTIMYAFYLNETCKSDQLCTVPVINMKRADLGSHAEIKWLIESCQIDQSSLFFIDEIDLSYYDLFGSLKLVLVNSHTLSIKQEALKEAVVETFSCRKGESTYPWVETVTVGQDCSCCTLISEKFALTSPEILTGQGFSRLLLAGILTDTGNLTHPHCTSKDKYMVTLLLHGAGHFGCKGLYYILKYKMYDVSDLRIVDILRKDFKKWKRVGKPEAAGSRLMVSHIGMSSIAISIAELLTREDYSFQEIRSFQQLEKLRLLTIVSGYYDSQKKFKREILVSAESMEIMRNLILFFDSIASQLPLKVLHQPGLRDEMQAFEINKVTSRKTIERLLEQFVGITKG